MAKSKVDPMTGKPSTEANAISLSAFNNRRKVDPVTGKPSTEANAISSSAFYKRRRVDPVTGEPSVKDNSITYSEFYTRKKVDPDTGKPSNETNAISYCAFYNRKKVDPETGKPSNAPNAITKSIYKNRKKVDPETGKPSDKDNSISYQAFLQIKKEGVIKDNVIITPKTVLMAHQLTTNNPIASFDYNANMQPLNSFMTNSATISWHPEYQMDWSNRTILVDINRPVLTQVAPNNPINIPNKIVRTRDNDSLAAPTLPTTSNSYAFFQSSQDCFQPTEQLFREQHNNVLARERLHEESNDLKATRPIAFKPTNNQVVITASTLSITSNSSAFFQSPQGCFQPTEKHSFREQHSIVLTRKRVREESNEQNAHRRSAFTPLNNQGAMALTPKSMKPLLNLKDVNEIQANFGISG